MLAIPVARDMVIELNIRQYRDIHPPRRRTLSPEGMYYQSSHICDCQLYSHTFDSVLRLDKAVNLVSIVDLTPRAKSSTRST